MAIVYSFGGKQVVLPGIYSTIKSGENNPSVNASYGNILVVDTGTGANYGGGKGITSTVSDVTTNNGAAAAYSFNNPDTMQSFMRGGVWWNLALPLFKPEIGVAGCSNVYYVRAADTTPATITFSPTGGGYLGGTFEVYTKDEGLGANGVQVSSVLTRGYAVTLQVGDNDPNLFTLKFWVGTFKGLAADGLPYDNILEADCKPVLICKSVEFSTMAQLFAWAANDSVFNSYFTIKTQTATGAGTVTSDDLALYTGNILATGGLETFSTAKTDLALTAVKDVAYTFILSDKFGDEAKGVDNGKYLNHVLTDAKYRKFVWVGGGADQTKFYKDSGGIVIANSSGDISTYFNSNRVIVAHGNPKVASPYTGTGYRIWDTLYKAAITLGRTAGLPPQVPNTFKSINISGEVHILSTKEREIGLQAGILMTYFDEDFNKFTILQGVNSLQRNTFLINTDATSYCIQAERIFAYVDMALLKAAKTELLSAPNGVNRNTLSPEFLRDWTRAKLNTMIATDQADNVILSVESVTVSNLPDGYAVNYTYYINTEIDKIFFTGNVKIG